MGFFGSGDKKHVKVTRGTSQTDGSVSFKSGAKPGRAGSGRERNDRLSARFGKETPRGRADRGSDW